MIKEYQNLEITVPLCESFAEIGIAISEEDLRKFEAALYKRGLNVAHLVKGRVDD